MPALLAVPSPVVCISRIWFVTLVSCRLWTLFTPSVTDLALDLASLSSLVQDYQLCRGGCFVESDGRSVSQEFTDIIELYYHFVKALDDPLKFVTVIDFLYKCCVGHRI